MTQLVLQPCSNAHARKHFAKTVERGVDPTPLRAHVTPGSELDAFLALQERVFVWGVKPKQGGPKKQWDLIRPGDIACFYAKKQFIALATVTRKWQHAALAQALWPELGATDGTYEYLYFLENVVLPDDLTAEDFFDPIAWNVDHTVRRIHVLDDERSSFILRDVPAVRQYAEVQDAELLAPEVEEALSGLAPEARDILRSVLTRSEQKFLKQQLLQGRTEAPCAICGQTFTRDLLIAAHLKPRAHCTPGERQDYAHIAVLMCALGCDALYERGYLVIGLDGVIEAGPKVPRPVRVQALTGRTMLDFRPGQQSYVDWHRAWHSREHSP